MAKKTTGQVKGRAGLILAKHTGRRFCLCRTNFPRPQGTPVPLLVLWSNRIKSDDAKLLKEYFYFICSFLKGKKSAILLGEIFYFIITNYISFFEEKKYVLFPQI